MALRSLPAGPAPLDPGNTELPEVERPDDRLWYGRTDSMGSRVWWKLESAASSELFKDAMRVAR